MKKQGITALVCVLLWCAAPVWAGMMIYPKFINFTDKDRVREMTLVNPSQEETVTYRVRFKYARQNPDGTYTDVEKPDFLTAKDLLRFSPRSVTLGPGKSQRVKILKRIPADTPAGEYTGYIVFTQIPDEKPLQKPSSAPAGGVRLELTAVPSFSIPVVIVYGSPAPDTAKISFLDIRTTAPGKKEARVRLERNGSVSSPASRTVRGDVSVWSGGKMLGIIKGKYLLAGNQRVDAAVPLDESLFKPGDAAEVLFTEASEQDGADVARILARAPAQL